MENKKYLARDRDRVLEQIDRIIFKQAYHETRDMFKKPESWGNSMQHEFERRRKEIISDLIEFGKD